MDSDTRKSKAKKLIELCLGKFMQFMQIQGEHFSSVWGGGHNMKLESCLLETFRSIKGSFIGLKYFCVTPIVFKGLG